MIDRTYTRPPTHNCPFVQVCHVPEVGHDLETGPSQEQGHVTGSESLPFVGYLMDL